MSQSVLDIITAHKARQKQERAKYAPDAIWNPLGLIFTTEEGLPIRDETYQRAFKTVCAKADPPITNASPHACRHTCATLMIMRGMSLPLIAKLLGHTDLVMLTTLYVHVSRGLVQGQEDVLTDLLPLATV